MTVYRGGKRTSMLTIDNVHARHAGKYSCRARNHASAVNFTTELIVNGTLVLLDLMEFRVYFP